MKKLLLAMTLITSTPYAFSEADSQCRQLYEKHCGAKKTDSCFKMNMRGQQLERPDSDVVEEIKEKRFEILKQARVFGVNPRAIVSSLISVNIVKAEGIGEVITKMILREDENSIGIGYGIGRLTADQFGELEKFSSKYSPRVVNPQNKTIKLRNPIQVKKLIHSGEADIEYTVAFLKQRQLAYEKGGFDIGNDIPLMSTIYGLPSVENRVRTHKNRGTKPSFNTWGVISICHKDLIDEILGSEEISKKSKLQLGQREPRYNDPSVLRDVEENLKDSSSTDNQIEHSRATSNGGIEN
jgi:hypothetical protein